MYVYISGKLRSGAFAKRALNFFPPKKGENLLLRARSRIYNTPPAARTAE